MPVQICLSPFEHLGGPYVNYLAFKECLGTNAIGIERPRADAAGVTKLVTSLMVSTLPGSLFEHYYVCGPNVRREVLSDEPAECLRAADDVWTVTRCDKRDSRFSGRHVLRSSARTPEVRQ